MYVHFPFDPANPTLGIYSKDILANKKDGYMVVHC